jgi:LysM repeat protein
VNNFARQSWEKQNNQQTQQKQKTRKHKPMDNENPKPQSGGLKLMTVFIVVLALHVLVIGGISAYHLFFRGDGSSTAIAQKDADKESVESPVTDPAAHASTPNAPLIETSPDANSGMPTHDDKVSTDSKVEAPLNPTAPMAVAPAVKPGTTSVIKPGTIAIAPETIKSATTAALVIAPPMANTTEYVVKPGDSLFRIAHQHDESVAQLKSLNGLKSDVLHLGQKLKISVAPAHGRLALTTAPAPAAVASTSAEAVEFYTVVKGDTLSKIARQFKTTPGAIMSANNLSDPHKLAIGYKLKIPSQQARNDAVDTQTASPKPFKAPAKERSDLVMNK